MRELHADNRKLKEMNNMHAKMAKETHKFKKAIGQKHIDKVTSYKMSLRAAIDSNLTYSST